MKQLDRSPNGDVISGLITVLAGRRFDLVDSNWPHPFQALSAGWRTFGVSLVKFVDELALVQIALDPDGQHVTGAFRRLTYDAAELFDVYMQLLKQLGDPSNAEKKQFEGYRKALKSLRDPWGMICNKFKHESAQIAFVWVAPQKNGLRSARYMIQKYIEGDALAPHDKIHTRSPHSVCLVRAGHELLHALLRADLHAADLIRALADRPVPELASVPATLPIGQSLTTLMPMKATVLPNESAMFDGLSLDALSVRLVRCSAYRLTTPMKIKTVMVGDGVTRKFPYA